ncbi:MAG TPA: sialidase family protein, partial [Candidatus Thermoplasmatota archaeon]|nr:sialidase family protein [Candidatus Thermoplasmatota archaeon]
MRRALTLALLVALAASALHAPPVAGPAAAAGGHSREVVGVMRLLEGPAYEPTIGITAAGNIFYSGGTPQNDPAFPGEAWVHGSYDNGRTWVNTTRAIAENDVEIYDPYLHVDRDTGRIFRLMMQAWSVGGNG